MSFPVDYQTTVDGVTIKCSKPFNELGTLTVDDLREYAIAGIFDIATGRGGNSLTTFTPLGVDGMADYMPVYYLKDGAFSNHVGYHSSYLPTLNAPHYGFSILTYGLQWQNVRSTTNDARLVLDVDIQKLYVDTPTLYENTINKNNDADISTLDSITYYETHDVGVVKTIDNDSNTQIHCMDVFIYGDQFYIFPSSYAGGMPRVSSLYRWYNNWQSAAADQINTSFIQPYYRDSDEVYAAFADDSSLDGFMFTGIEWGEAWTIILDLPENEREQTDACIVITYSGSSGWEGNCKAFPKHGLRSALLGFANSCLKFKYNNTLYKPLIADGVVYDYTDDMSAESEFDSITTVTGNNVPVTPPAPGPSGDDEDNKDPVNTAGAPYAKGLVNYYAMTAGSVLIEHISDALSTWDLQNTGKDLYKNLVSCKLIKPPAAIPTTGSEPFTIYGEKPQYEGADITLPVVSGNPDATFGPYSISRKFNDFRDYAPYTRVSIYLPYCGWCDLPSHVVGRNVSVKYFTDIIAATVRAVVFCGNNIVAEAAGVMGIDIPFTADAVGMKQAGVVSGLTAYAGGALQTAAGVASIVTTKGGKGIGETLSGASKLVSAYTQTAIAFNENTTEISGKNGDGCCLSGATSIIIKIIRPKYGASSEPPFVPAGFAHSIGFVSNKQVRVGNVSGLLIADNVDTSGIAGATDAERAEIKRVLETGLIVNDAPE